MGRVRERFFRQGLDDAALERSMPDRVYKSTLDGRASARLIAFACSQAPEGRDRWSMRLLADKAVELGIVDAISHERRGHKDAQKNELKPHLVKEWVIPPKKSSASSPSRMEEVLDLYEEPYDPLLPVVCFDERPC